MSEGRRFRWDDAAVLLALVRERSLGRAALKLEVNTSTVGRRLDALEAALGLRLFDRRNEGVTPTAAAELLVPQAERMEAAANAIEMHAEGFETTPEGLVRVSAPPGVCDHLVAARVGEIIDRYPGIRLELISTTSYVDLDRREADLAIRARRPDRGDLVFKKLGEQPVIPMAAPRLVAAHGPLDDVDAVRWLGWSQSLSHIPTGKWLEAHIPAERLVLRSNGVNGLIEAARSGLGVVLLNRIFLGLSGLEPMPLTPELEASLAPLPQEAAYLVGHAALRDVPRVDAVWRYIEETFDLLVLP